LINKVKKIELNKDQINNFFLFLSTNDGSFSLKLLQNEKETEGMHSHGGAFSETIYVY
jgi:hypothetical protein